MFLDAAFSSSEAEQDKKSLFGFFLFQRVTQRFHIFPYCKRDSEMDVEIQINRGRSLLVKEGETLAFWIMAVITTTTT